MCKDCGCGQSNSMRATLSVHGMTCEHCKASVEGALLKLPGLMAAEAHVAKNSVVVDYNGDEVTTDAMKAAIEAIGFDVDPEVKTEAVHGHHHHGIMGTISKFFGNK